MFFLLLRGGPADRGTMILSMVKDQHYKLQEFGRWFDSSHFGSALTIYFAERLSLIQIQSVFTLPFRHSRYSMPFDIGLNYCSENKG